MPSAQPSPLSRRVLWYLERAEVSEENPHFQTDIRISWITVKLAAEGEAHPHFWATYRVLRMSPDQVWTAIVGARRAKLRNFYEEFYGEPLPPKKPAASERDVKAMRAAA